LFLATDVKMGTILAFWLTTTTTKEAFSAF